MAAGFAVGHAHLSATAASSVNWQLWTAGLAFTIALSGLGWTENGNDYSRYLRPDAPRPLAFSRIRSKTTTVS